VGITATGELVGNWDNASSEGEGFYTLDDGHSFVPIDVPASIATGAVGAINTSVSGANDEGTIFGTYFGSGGGSGGFVFENGVYQAVNVPGGSGTHVTGVDAAGDIFGTYSPTGSSVTVGFIDSNGTFAQISDPSFANTYIAGVTAFGEAFGSFGLSGSTLPSFTYQNGVFTLVDPPGAVSSTLTGVDDAGNVVGWSSGGGGAGYVYSGGNYSIVDAVIDGVNGAGEIFGNNFPDAVLGVPLAHYLPNDFNGDGNSDLIWRNSNGDASIWNSNGSGGFTGQDLGNVGNGWQIAGTGYFNGNTDADILWRNANGDTAIWNSNGSGGFTNQSLGIVDNSWQIAGTGDYNGDGQSDILWRNANGDTAIWNSNGSGGFTNQSLGNVGNGWQIAGTGDFNGGGQSDILWRNANGDTAIWNSNGSGGFTNQTLGIVDNSWQVARTGDFNGDGKSDILWRNANGDTAIWYSNGRAGSPIRLLELLTTAGRSLARATSTALELWASFGRTATATQPSGIRTAAVDLQPRIWGLLAAAGIFNPSLPETDAQRDIREVPRKLVVAPDLPLD